MSRYSATFRIVSANFDDLVGFELPYGMFVKAHEQWIEELRGMQSPFKYPMVDQSLFWTRERHPVYDDERPIYHYMPFRWVLGLSAGGREMTDLIEEAVTTRLVPLVESWFDYQTLVERMERNISGEFVWISPMSHGLVLAKLDAAPVEEVEADLNALTGEDDAGFVAWARARLAAR